MRASGTSIAALPFTPMIEALTSLASRLWQPWLAVVVLAIGVLLLFSTGLVQVRGLKAAIAGARRRDDARAIPWGVLAVGCGAGGLGAGALAVQWGGRGAIVWMWIAMFLAMGWRFAESVLRAPVDAGAPADPARPATQPLLRRVWSFASIAAALAIAGVFGGQQLGVLLEQTWGVRALQGSIGFGVLAAIVVAVPGARRAALMAVPVGLVAWIVVAAMLLFQDDLLLSLALGDAYNEAFGVRPALTGAVVGGVAHALAEGVLAATLAGGIGQGAVAGRGSLRLAMLAPLVGVGLLGSTGALAVATEPALVSLSTGDQVPLERHHSRGLRPSQQVGQTIVLPKDSPLEDNQTYAFLVRANPRGLGFGAKLDAENNAVILPAWQVTEAANEVVFRMRDKDPLAKNASWDVRIPVTREILPGRGGPEVLRLKPVNPDLDFKKLVAYYELGTQPYVPMADYHFVGKVGIAQSPDETLGEHLAMFEAEGADRPFNPKLHEFFRAGYRGPYADVELERPPWGWVAPAGFDGEVGSVVDLRLVASPRGEPFARLNRTGGVEAPPWDLLTGVRELVVQHTTDPEQDIIIPVETKQDGYRMRFVPKDKEWEDFRKLAGMPEYRPTPFVRVRDVDFVGEIHGDARLGPEYAGRRAIVAHHPVAEPQGPWGEYLPYVPHPAELVSAGMRGPVLARDGAARIGGRLHGEGLGWAANVAAIAMIVLGLGSIVGWSSAAAEDPGARRMIGLAIAAAAAAGGATPWVTAQATAGITAALGVLAATALVLTHLGRIRDAAKGADPTGDRS
jgi:hypothetical protein